MSIRSYSAALGRRNVRISAIDSCASGFDVAHFFRLLRGERKLRNGRKIYLASLKSLHSIFSNQNSALVGTQRMVGYGCCYRYLHSLPRPRFPFKVSFGRTQETDDSHTVAIDRQVLYSIMLRRMCGISLSTLPLWRASILARCMDVYPVELRSILYKFTMAHIHTMCMEDLIQMDQLLKLGLDDRNNSILLGYLSLKTRLDPNLLSSNMMMKKLLSFVCQNHPALLSTQ